VATKTIITLTYSLGWISGLFFLLTRKDRLVRHHARQSILIFGFLNLLALIPLFTGLAVILAFILWLVLLFKASRGEKFLCLID
jgi:uncharacterized membrane protein